MPRRSRWVDRALFALAASLVGAATREVRAGDPAVTFPVDAARAPAVRYGALSRAECEAELTQRGVPFQSAGDARGVLAPVRLTGPLHGVSFHSALPEAARATSPYEIVDCRLALALDDFAAILERAGVVEVVHLSAYRPPPRRWAEGRLGGQHHGALAMDVASFVRRDGTVLRVERDFHGRIGARTCGTNAGPRPPTPEAEALRAIVCLTADARLFNVELTPDFNRAHRNHLHLEVTQRVAWFLLR